MSKYLLFLCLILLPKLTFSQDSYQVQWEKVEKLELKNLPKSALAITDSIFQQAKSAHNAPQWLKAMLYQSKFALKLEENAQLAIIDKFEKEIATAEPPVSNLLHSMLATFYWQYFQENRYQFYNRSQTTPMVDSLDFRTWDLNRLYQHIHAMHVRALQDPERLQEIPIDQFKPILTEEEKTKHLTPSLFDLLAHRALAFYKTAETSIHQPKDKFLINDPRYFQEEEEYLKSQRFTGFSRLFEALKIYGTLTQYHRKAQHEAALVAIQLERLKFIAANYTGESKNKHYEAALTRLYRQYSSKPISTLITYDLAALYDNMADEYSPHDATDHQFKRKEALALLNESIADFPDGLGIEFCKQLKRSIVSPFLHLTSEKFLPVQQEARILAEYKNVDQLDFTIYALNHEQSEKFNALYDEHEKTHFVEQLSPYQSWQSPLVNEGDYQPHRMDNLLPSLAAGNYVIMATSDLDGIQATITAFQFIQVTDMALIHHNIGNEVTLQVIDRQHGTPIKGASVRLSNDRYNKRKLLPQSSLITNEEGFVHFSVEDRLYGVEVHVQKDGQTAIFSNFSNYHRYSYDNENTISTHLFTDRSIYRPGQTVFFKGILVKRSNHQSETVPEAGVEVVLKDVNGEKVSELLLESNAYGAFSGEFVLPTSGLTGNFTLEVNKNNNIKNVALRGTDFLGGHHRIAVEEYKRPTFEANFRPIEQEYQVNDSVLVYGKATAFSGSKISDANVSYRVVREVHMPMWYYSWRRTFPVAHAQEVAVGSAMTDGDGHFNIPFKAIPDETVPKADHPVFHYKVIAEVTDINGETRTAQTTVNVGYHALLLDLEAPETLKKQQDSISLKINSTNLNDSFVPAQGTLKIYKLRSPGRVLRNSPLSIPDYRRWEKEEFVRRFPHEPYGEEGEPENWEKGSLIKSRSFDTAKEKELQLARIDQWSTGRYLVEIEAMDKFGQKVTEKGLFTLMDNVHTMVPDHQLLDIQLDKASYSPGNTAKLSLGTAAKNLTVSVFLEKDGAIKNTWLLNLKNGYESLSIPVESSDLGGFVIHYTTAFANASVAGEIQVNVPYPKKDLEIETLTFRDHIQPGAEQTWTFKVKGPQKDHVAAELLASMYDASLDQFTPHQWRFARAERNYISQTSFQSHFSFDTDRFDMNRFLPSRYFTTHETLPLTQLNWFGFHFTNEYYFNYRYIQSLREKWIPIASKVSYSFDASLQKGFAKGKITNVEGDPLPGVTIDPSGNHQSVVSDIDGEFIVEASPGDTLTFQLIGYLSATANLAPKRNVVHVVLTEDATGLEEVVVTGYQANRKESSAALAMESQEDANHPPAEIAFRAKASGISTQALYIIDGKISTTPPQESDVASRQVLAADEAMAIYGSQGQNGAIIITTHAGQASMDQQLVQIQARSDLRETAFFYPHLSTDSTGNISFSFTAPEALTKWKLQLLAHTKAVDIGYKQLQAITQKDLMVTPNAPRFLREGDKLVFSAKISNLSADALTGKAQLELTDPFTGKSLNQQLSNLQQGRSFQVAAKGNTEVRWSLEIPEGTQAVQYKVVAAAGSFSDGEQRILPVLSNRMLVTETMPMWINDKGKKSFEMVNLTDHASTTLAHHQLTLEVTSNPAWYAVQALPYLMEYPYECAEQTYARFFANAVAKHIVDSHPRIKAVFEHWKNQDTETLLSNLEKNQELKSLVIQETPWLRDAQSESEQKQRIALLFETNKISNELSKNISKLYSMQMSSGGFPWFKGSRYPNRYITQHIVTGLAELQRMEVQAAQSEKITTMITKAMNYLDEQLLEDYKKLLAQAKISKTDSTDTDKLNAVLRGNLISSVQVHYLYLRTLLPKAQPSGSLKEAIQLYQQQALRQWTSLGLQEQAMIALMSHRTLSTNTAQEILKSLVENSINNPELGRYWKANKPGWLWYKAPIETQAFLIRTFSEIPMERHTTSEQTKLVNEMKVWLLKQKQTNHWSNTKASASAIQALLLAGSDWLSTTETVQVSVGHQKVSPKTDPSIQAEAGTGYFKKSWSGDQVEKTMGNVTLTQEKDGIAWGALYWQYFEDLDKIQENTATPLKISKELLIKENTDQGEIFHPIDGDKNIVVGDLIKVRLKIMVDRDMDFVHLKDMRAAGFEPVNVLSRYKYQDGLGYYESTRDASTHFFFERLEKGVYVFEYDVRANNAGTFSNGISTIQCMYAPEFSSHSKGKLIHIER
ncbi:alpha-2-macroglobulin family protein [Echinicola vietnamensis]|nr:MG2 domain-containing protein [Echinicola vietnamensis]